ncbi:MAG: TonB-dependent receptor [Sphingomonas sp.]|uniref:TonB-dependent receptor n=1 Tax=Sphingomonas sp. TaxID=28214 RepID=UPI0035A8E4AE|nr:TonB-dependent receptor [Sphingomonas sp.]
MVNHRYLASTAIGLLAIMSAPAMAQTAPTVTSESDKPEATAKSNGLPDMVVTARRREEKLQDVPLAVTSVTETTFRQQQIVNLEGLHLSIPNTTIVRNTTTTNAAQVYIRGIGQDESTYNSEQGVAIYIDGVPLGKQNGAMLDLIEFERIEVLRGPQGTLYGRNATGGAVKFETKRPSLTTFRGVGDLTIGSFGQFDARGTVSLPIIVDKLAVKVDFVSRSDDGFVTDRTLGERINNLDRQTGRVSALWQATDRLSVYATYDRTLDRSNINVPIPTQINAACVRTAANPTPTCNGQRAADYSPRFGSQRVADRSIPNLNKFDGQGGSVQFTYDLDTFQIVSTSGYRDFQTLFAGDLDGARDVSLDFIQDLKQDQFSQEVQIGSLGKNRFNWVVGGFYFNENVTQGAQNTFQATNNDNRQGAQSYAFFGEANYEVLDGLRVTAGGRYTRDTKQISGSAFTRIAPAVGSNRIDGARLFTYNANLSFSNFSPRVVVDYKPTEDILLYASWSKGYKAGVFSAGRPTTLAAALGTLPPETVTTYEIGAKLSWFNNRLTLNLSAFTSDYNNLQLSFLSGGVFFIAPAGARIRGLEAEFSARPIRQLTIYGNAGYLDAKITQVTINPATGTPVGALFIGAPLKHAPEFQGKIGFDLSDDFSFGRLGFGGNATHQSSITRNNAVTPGIISPNVTVFDTQAYVETLDAKWRLTFGVKNLTDEVYWLQGVNVGGPGFNALGAAAPSPTTIPLVNNSRFYAPPRTWSLTLRYAF